jgi:hypothetical protein
VSVLDQPADQTASSAPKAIHELIAADARELSANAASAFVCYARSPVSYGWGSSGNLGSAKVIALRECAVRTPRGLVCILTTCN